MGVRAQWSGLLQRRYRNPASTCLTPPPLYPTFHSPPYFGFFELTFSPCKSRSRSKRISNRKGEGTILATAGAAVVGDGVVGAAVGDGGGVLLLYTFHGKICEKEGRKLPGQPTTTTTTTITTTTFLPFILRRQILRLPDPDHESTNNPTTNEQLKNEKLLH
ncbi:hypothetical protein M0804_009639 [Polistes exclamans]|nr:hypothetical protein M0804_009639 [Polistes exclamans]